MIYVYNISVENYYVMHHHVEHQDQDQDIEKWVSRCLETKT